MNKPNKDRTRSSETAGDVSLHSPLFSTEELENLSTLQLFDLLSGRLKERGLSSSDALLLRRRVAELEELQDQARGAVEKLADAVEKLRSPALRLGTLLHWVDKNQAMVCVGGTDYFGNV